MFTKFCKYVAVIKFRNLQKSQRLADILADHYNSKMTMIICRKKCVSLRKVDLDKSAH